MEKPVDRTLFSQIYMLKFLHQDAAKWNGHLQALASLMHCYEAAIDLEHIGLSGACLGYWGSGIGYRECADSRYRVFTPG